MCSSVDLINKKKRKVVETSYWSIHSDVKT